MAADAAVPLLGSAARLIRIAIVTAVGPAHGTLRVAHIADGTRLTATIAEAAPTGLANELLQERLHFVGQQLADPRRHDSAVTPHEVMTRHADQGDAS